MVELVFLEIKAANQRANRAIARVHGHEGAFDFRQLGNFPVILRRLGYPDQCARTNLDVRAGLVGQTRLRRPQAFSGDGHLFAVQTHRNDPLGAGLQHDSRHDVSVVGVLGQGVVNGVFNFRGVGRQVDEFFGTPVDLPALVIHDALAQGLVSHGLVGGLESGVDIQPARVGFFAILVEHKLANGFGHVFGMHAPGIASGPDLKFFFPSRFCLLGIDEAVLLHALDDVELTRPGAAGVGDRVVGRRRLGQAGQHGGFGNADIPERLAEIRFRCSGKAVGAISQKNLVHVDLENLVLRQ